MNDDLSRLGDVLERATDAIEPRIDHADVLARARRRRGRQRALAVGATAAVAVLAVVVSLRVADDAHRTRELPPATQTPSVSGREAPWDPRDVASLPAADPGVAALLPDVLDVPDVAPHLEDDPVDAAVLSVDDGADVLLLGTDGRWRCVVVDGKTQPSPVLSPRGTRVAVAVADGIVTVDLATGSRTHRPLPAGFESAGGDPLWMHWLDERRLLIPDGGDEWVLDVDRGTDERAPGSESPAEPWTLGRPAIHDAAFRWDVRPVAELADGSALLRVAPPRDADQNGWWLVRWDPDSGDLALATTVDADADRATSFARDLVAAP